MTTQEFIDTELLNYRTYRFGYQNLADATGQLMLSPLADMEKFLLTLIQNSPNETDLERQKLDAARSQLELIVLGRQYAEAVQSALERREVGK